MADNVEMIDTDAMQAEVDGFSQASANIEALQADLQQWWSQAVDARRCAPVVFPLPVKLGEILDWLLREKPKMQQRLDLALAVAQATNPPNFIFGVPGHGAVVPVDLDLIEQTQDLVTAANSGSLTAAQWAEIEQLSTDKKYANYAAWFGVTFYNQVPPEKLADLVANLSSGYEEDSRQTGFVYHQQGLAAGKEWADRINNEYESRVEALGGLLGDASRSGYPRLRSDYADDVVQVFQTKDSPLPAALSMVLSYGSYDTRFGATIADGAYAYERSDGFPGWGGSSSPNYVVMPGGSHRTDVMAGVMTMLGNSPGAAQQFFTTGGTVPVTVDGQTVQVSEKLQYLTTEHSWDMSLSSESLSDGGDGLGQALEAATTTYRNQEATGQASATIATQMFAIMGQSQEVADAIPENMKDSVATIAADYSLDVIRVCRDGGASDTLTKGYANGAYYSDAFPPGMPDGALLASGEMANVFHGLGRGPNSDENLQTVLTGWAAADSMRANYIIVTNPSEDRGWRTVIDQDASALGFITDKALEGVGTDKEVAEKKAELINDAMSLAATLPPVKAVVATGEIGKWMWTTALDLAKDAAKNDVTDPMTDASTAQGDKLTNTKNSAMNQAVTIWLDAMLNNGAVPQDAIDAGTEPAHDVTGSPVPSPVSVDDGVYHVNTDSPVFNDWCATNNIAWDDIRGAIAQGLGWPK